ncbi:MAG: diaminopimelate epimerase [Thioalkalivibrionaceae bacterium]
MHDPEQATAYAAADFDAPHQAFVDLFASIFSDITAAAPLTGVVLDIGCGPGDVALRFAAAHPQCSVLGIDAASAMLDAGRQLRQHHPAGSRLRVECRDALSPWLTPDGQPQRFATLISNSLLHHLHQPNQLWQSIKRLAYPRSAGGSRFFLMDLRRPDDEASLAAMVERYAANEPEILRRDFAASLAAALRPEEVAEQLRAAGLIDLTVETYGDRHLLVFGRVYADDPAPDPHGYGDKAGRSEIDSRLSRSPRGVVQSLAFTKMHGLGNDFVVIDGIRQSVDLSPQNLRHLADRHRGIGCDQILVVEPSNSPDADFRYRIFNADGGEVEHCGNGARCFAAFVQRAALTTKNCVIVETLAGLLTLDIERRHADHLGADVRVAMGVPTFSPDAIPFDATHADVTARDNGDFCLRLEPDVDAEPAVPTAPSESLRSVRFTVVGLGNPHAVIEVDNIDKAPVERLGRALQSHPAFPRSVNVGFAQVTGSDGLRVRVFERGAGETEACGTGATAAMVAFAKRARIKPRTTVTLNGGELVIEWKGEGEHALMSGPARVVFDGQINLAAFPVPQ